MGNYHEADAACAEVSARYDLFCGSQLERSTPSHPGLEEVQSGVLPHPSSISTILRSGLACLATRLRGRVLFGLLAGAVVALPHGKADARMAQHQAGWAGETGVASFYGRSHQGQRTASGSRFNDAGLTAAHPWLPFGTKVRVTVLTTGRSVIVTITDRLPARLRIVDLSLGAARLLGIVGQGIAKVSLEPVAL